MKLQLRKPQPLERDIQKEILEYLHRKGYFVWKEHSGGIMVDGGTRYMPIGLKGKSDILGMTRDGKFLAVEVKRPGGIVSPDQQEFIRQVTFHGGIAIVAYGIDDVIKAGL